MPGVLQWVLGGNIGEVDKTRAPHCKLADQPKGFLEADFGLLMRDDDALSKQIRADWLLLAERAPSSGDATSSSEAKGGWRGGWRRPCAPAAPLAAAACTWRPGLVPRRRSRGPTRPLSLPPPAAGVYMGEDATFIGCDASQGSTLLVPGAGVGALHAKVGAWAGALSWGACPWCRAAPSSLPAPRPPSPCPSARQVWKQDGSHYIRDLGSVSGTFVNGHRVAPQADVQLRPSDVVEFARQPAPEVFKVKLQHVSLRTDELHGHEYTNMLVGRRQEQVQLAREQQRQQAQAQQAAKRAQPVLSSL
jgi:zeaxanthin epoxidase